MMAPMNQPTNERAPSTISGHARWLVPLVAMLASSGCAAENEAPVPAAEHTATTNTDLGFEEFAAKTYQDPVSGIYVVDGDTPIENMEGLRAYYAKVPKSGGLTVATSGSAADVWSASWKWNLSYCVSYSFGANRNAVIAAMKQAGDAWHAVAGVRFVYVPSQDALCDFAPTSVVFGVKPTTGSKFLATSFFPSFDRARRNVLIDGSSFGTIAPFTLAGVLRHELGHTLGFQHEQLRLGFAAPPGCWELGNTNWLPVTSYDSASVMHYPQCNGTNTGDLVLTPRDISGAVQIYGGPLPF
jgi:hypothetical protein